MYVVVFVNSISNDSTPSLPLPTVQDSAVDTCTKGETPLAKTALVATWFTAASWHVEVVSLKALYVQAKVTQIHTAFCTHTALKYVS